MVDYHKLIPCNVIPSLHFIDVETQIRGDRDKLKGPTAAFNVFIDCADVLVNYMPCKEDGFTLQDWEGYLDRVKFGLIKESKMLGKTSVTQGVAQKMLDENRFDTPSKIFAKCGTNGMKLQVAVRGKAFADEEKKHPIVFIRFECKENPERTSPNKLKLGNWTLSKSPDRLEIHQGRLSVEMQNLGNELAYRKMDSPKVLHVYIKGPARDYWERASDDDKKAMEDDVDQLFEGVAHVPWNGKSYFMTQQEESDMEFLAAKSLYSNLHKAGLLPKVEVVSSWGIGRGSLQMGDFQLSVGMDDDVVQRNAVCRYFRDALKYGLAKELFDESKQYPPDAILVIALKSGFTILLDSPSESWLLREIQDAAKNPLVCKPHEICELNDDDNEGDEYDEDETTEDHVVIHEEDTRLTQCLLLLEQAILLLRAVTNK